jgi:membrane-associated phospholipid phosphatase
MTTALAFDVDDANSTPRAATGAVGAAVVVLIGYLALTLVPAMSSGSVAIAGVHLIALVGLALALRGLDRHAPPRWLLWPPLAAIPLLYAEIPTLIRGAGTSFHDATVQAWELRLFGESPVATLPTLIGSHAPALAISEVLHAAYVSYYLILLVPLVLLYMKGHLAAFAETLLALAVVYAASYAVFVFYPVQGPRYLWPASAEIPTGPIRQLTLWLLNNGASRGAAFPSSHVSASVTASLMALRSQPRVGLVASLATVLLAIGAVYGDFHYATDVLAGGGLGLAVGGLMVTSFMRRLVEPVRPVVPPVAPRAA